MIRELKTLFYSTKNFTLLYYDYNNIQFNNQYLGITNVIEKKDNEIIIEDLFENNNIHIKGFSRKKWVFQKNNILYYNNRYNGYEKIFNFLYQEDLLTLASVNYYCGNDIYKARLILNNNKIHFEINIKSDIKNILIKYIYG